MTTLLDCISSVPSKLFSIFKLWCDSNMFFYVLVEAREKQALRRSFRKYTRYDTINLVLLIFSTLSFFIETE